MTTTTQQFGGLKAGRQTQQYRAEIKERIKNGFRELDREAWFEIIEHERMAGIQTVVFVQWLPYLGSGHDYGREGAATRMLSAAGIGWTRNLGDLTPRQTSALVDEILAFATREIR